MRPFEASYGKEMQCSNEWGQPSRHNSTQARVAQGNGRVDG